MNVHSLSNATQFQGSCPFCLRSQAMRVRNPGSRQAAANYRLAARVLPGKKPAPYSTLDVERWALDVCLVKPQQGSPLIEYQRFIRDLPPSRRYLIGVSGGRDSIAL